MLLRPPPPTHAHTSGRGNIFLICLHVYFCLLYIDVPVLLIILVGWLVLGLTAL